MPGHVAIMYLRGTGSHVFEDTSRERATGNVEVEVAPGRLVPFCNTTYQHMLKAQPAHNA